MKKLIPILALQALVLLSFAQVKYTVAGAVNLTGLKNDWGRFDNPGIHPRFGYSFGGGIEFPVKKVFFVNSQLNLMAKNFAFDVEDFYGAGTTGYDRYSVLYIDLPVLAGYNFREVRFFAGTFYDFCLGGTNKHKLEYFNGTISQSTAGIDASKELKNDTEDKGIFPLQNFNFFDAGIVLGIGHQNKNYSIDLSYRHGLVNIFPKTEDNTINRADYSLMTRIFTLQLNFYI